MHRVRPQILVFSYHKSGTTLFGRVMTAVAKTLDLRLANQYGMALEVDPGADIVLLPHSLLGFELARPFRAVRVVRDPRDIWVSSYLYHLHTSEQWCTNTDFDPSPPIRYPRIHYSVQHRPERWKRDYLAGLGGKSYQRNLLDRDRAAGLGFELARYTGWTLAAMRAWRLRAPAVLDVQLEAIVQDFDRCMHGVFRHLGLNDVECETALRVAASQDMARMSDAEIAASQHIHSRELSKWRGVLTADQVAEFERRHGDLIAGLGYSHAAPAHDA